MNPALKGTSIAAIAQGYVEADRTANGVCLYCKFWPCVETLTPERAYARKKLQRLRLARVPQLIAERAAMLR